MIVEFFNDVLTVRAAYGRRYTNQAQIKADWKADRDFVCALTGRMINRTDAQQSGLRWVNVRYANDAKVLPLKP